MRERATISLPKRHAGDPARAARSRTALRAAGLVIGGGAFFTARSEQPATLALRHAVPTVYTNRKFAAMCYVPTLNWATVIASETLTPTTQMTQATRLAKATRTSCPRRTARRPTARWLMTNNGARE